MSYKIQVGKYFWILAVVALLVLIGIFFFFKLHNFRDFIDITIVIFIIFFFGAILKGKVVIDDEYLVFHQGFKNEMYALKYI